MSSPVSATIPVCPTLLPIGRFFSLACFPASSPAWHLTGCCELRLVECWVALCCCERFLSLALDASWAAWKRFHPSLSASELGWAGSEPRLVCWWLLFAPRQGCLNTRGRLWITGLTVGTRNTPTRTCPVRAQKSLSPFLGASFPLALSRQARSFYFDLCFNPILNCQYFCFRVSILFNNIIIK